jgi:hypothetical protein
MAIIELIAEGQQDAYITGKPSVTYFDAVYLRHTPFIVETHEIPFDTTPRLDDTAIATIPYKGDIISDITLRTIFPALYTTPPTVYCYPLWPADVTTPVRVYILTSGVLTLALQASSAVTAYWSTYNVGFWAGNFTGFALTVAYNASLNKFVFSSGSIGTIYFADELSASFWGFDIRNPDVRFGTAYGFNLSGGSRTAQLTVTLSGWVPGYAPPINANYYDGLGTRVIRSASLLIGGQRVSTITGDSIDLENDLEVPYENQMALTALVGKNDLNYKLAPRYCFTHVNFGMDNIPIGALDRHDVQVDFEFNKQSDLLPGLNTGTGIQDSNSYLVGDLRTVLGTTTYTPGRVYIYKDTVFWDEQTPDTSKRVFYDGTKLQTDPTAYTRVTRNGGRFDGSFSLVTGSYMYTISGDYQYLVRQTMSSFFNNTGVFQQSTVKYWGNFGYGDTWTGAIPNGEQGFFTHCVACADARYVYIRCQVNYIQASGRSIVMQTWSSTSLVFKFYGATSIGATEYNNFITFWRTRETTITSMTYASQVASGPDTLVTYTITSSVGTDPGKHFSPLIMRYDTFGDFNSASSYSFYSDLRSIWNGSYQGQYGITNSIYQAKPSFDGRYVNTSFENGGENYLIRIDGQNFLSAGGWTRVNLNLLSPPPTVTQNDSVLFSDGTWIYTRVSPYVSPYIWRFSITGDLTLNSSWQSINWSSFPLYTIFQSIGFGYQPEFWPFAYDGRYIYYSLGGGIINFAVAYYDTTKPFTSLSSWQWISKHRATSLPPDEWVYATAGGVEGPNQGKAASRIAVDASGNYYVMSHIYSDAVVPIYNQDGSLYANISPIAGYNQQQYMIKYGSDGLVKWITYFNNLVNINHIKFDASGNMRLAMSGGTFDWSYTGGTYYYTTNPGPSNQNTYQAWCASINTTTGALQWATAVVVNFPASGPLLYQGGAMATDLALDSSGNAYFCGFAGHQYAAHNILWYTAGSTTIQKTISRGGGGWSAFISKVNSSGAFQWGAYAPSSSSAAFPSTITLDPSGNPIMCGAFQGGTLTAYTSADVSFGTASNPYTWGGFLIKYNATGGGTSVTAYAPTSNTLQIDSATTDTSGNIFISGKEAVGSTYRCFLRKYDSSFVVQWTAVQVSATAGSYAGVTQIRCDSAGNIVMVGAFQSSAITVQNADGSVFSVLTNTPENVALVDYRDVFIVKYNTSGVAQWTQRWGGERDDFPGGLDIDASNNIYLYVLYRSTNFTITNVNGTVIDRVLSTATVGESTGASNLLLAKLNSAGSLLWRNNMIVSYDTKFITSAGTEITGVDIATTNGFQYGLQGTRRYFFLQTDWFSPGAIGNNNIMSFDPISTSFSFTASLLVEYAYLGEEELKWFKKSRHNFLLEQKQVLKTSLTTGKTALPLQFVGPVTDLWVTARTDANLNTYTYSNITSMALTLNTCEMFNYNGVMFNLLAPFEVADNFPTRNVFMYRFGAPTNFSRIRDKVLTVEMSQPVNIQVWARTFNVLVVQNGMGGLLFNSYT